VVLHPGHLDHQDNPDLLDHRVHLAKTRLNQPQLDQPDHRVMLVIKDQTVSQANWVSQVNGGRLANPVVVTIALNRRQIQVTILVTSIKESRRPKKAENIFYSS